MSLPTASMKWTRPGWRHFAGRRRLFIRGKTPFRRIPRVLSIFKRIGLERWLSGQLIDRFSDQFATDFPVSAAADYEAVFFAGGEQWSGFSNGITMLSVLCAMSRSNRNISIFPFSVKKRLLQSYSTERLASCFSRLSGKLIVRDSHSGEIVKQFAPGVINGADCVFSLADLAVDLPAAPRQEQNPVMIAVTEGDGSRAADLLPVIRNLLAGGYRVRLLTTCEREDFRDLQQLSKALGIEFFAPMTWQEVVAEFKSCAMVVTNRLHCMIFTFFADVPLIPLLNREKVVGVSRDADLPHALRHASELTPARVAEFLRNEERIRSKMAAYLEQVSQSHLSP